MIINPYIFAVASTLNTGLYAVYNADNSPNDSFGSNNGTLVNGATYAAGKINQAFSLDGVNDYISFPNNSLSILNTLTFSCWVKINSTGIFGIANSTSTINVDGWSLFMYGDITYLRIVDSGGRKDTQLPIAQSGIVGTWINLLFERTSSAQTIYLNNSSIGSVTPTPPSGNIYYTGTNICRFGIWESSFPLNGSLDCVSIWSRILTSDEKLELYNLGLGKQYIY